MIELVNNNTLGYNGKIYATDNAYDVARYIDGREEDTRILYDPRISTWYIGEAQAHIHRSLVIEGWKNGLYWNYDFKTEDELMYYYSNNEFVYLYYYKTKPFKANLTGDYEVHYIYDFGILDSHDILNDTVLKFEDTTLYKILEPRLIETEKENVIEQDATDDKAGL